MEAEEAEANTESPFVSEASKAITCLQASEAMEAKVDEMKSTKEDSEAPLILIDLI